MSYRNKTYVAFASSDIHYYRLMTAWRVNARIDFNFHNAHDIFVARDTSLHSTIRRKLRERLKNTKQVVYLASANSRARAAIQTSFLHDEIEIIRELELPVIFANLNGSRNIQRQYLPVELRSRHNISVSFGPSIIRYALDNYAPNYRANTGEAGCYYYKDVVYRNLGL